MRDWFSLPRVCVCVLVPILLVSFYFSVVPSVELAYGGKLLRSVALFDGESLEPSSCFEISDVIVFRIDSMWANWYSLVVSNGTCDVYAGSGGLDRLNPEVRLALYPPLFHAKTAYAYQLRVSAFNYPLPGGSVSDGTVGAFLVEGAKTSLALNVTYDDESHGLSMDAVLVNGESEPVANQTVSFYLQPDGNDTSLPDMDWSYLDSAETDQYGRASCGLICNIESGLHEVEARFNGSEDFGKSKADAFFTISQATPQVTAIGVNTLSGGVSVMLQVVDDDGLPLSDMLVTLEPLNVPLPAVDVVSDVDGIVSACFGDVGGVGELELGVKVWGDGFSSGLETVVVVGVRQSWTGEVRGVPQSSAPLGGSEGLELIHVGANVSDFYMLVPVKFYASMSLNRSLGVLHFSFYLDGSECVGGPFAKVPERLTPEGDDPVWLYDCIDNWEASEERHLENHAMVVQAVNASGVLVAEGSLSFNVTACPTNLRVVYPSTFVGDLRVTSSISRPRLYGPAENGYVYNHRLAPQMGYDGAEYVTDWTDGPKLILTKLYVNGSLYAYKNMLGSLLWTVYLPVSFAGYGILNVTAVNSQGIYYGDVVKELIPLTRVSVSETESRAEGNLSLDYSVGPLDENDRTYVAINSSLSVDVDLFHSPLKNASVSFLVANRTQYGTFCGSLDCSGADYVRLSSFYNYSASGSPLADVERSGKVDLFDVVKVTSNFGKNITDSGWKNMSRVDTNDNWVIDINDLVKVTSNFGKKINLLGGLDNRSVVVKFYDASHFLINVTLLDGQGFAKVPSGAKYCEAFWNGKHIGVVYELFDAKVEECLLSNYAGRVYAGFSFPGKGTYVVRVRLPSAFEVGVLGSVPSSINACLGGLGYVYVLKRPLRLSLSYTPSNVTVGQALSMVACAVDGVTGQPANGVYVTFCGDAPWAGQRVPTNQSGIAVYSAVSYCKKYDVYAAAGDAVYLPARTEAVSVDLRINTTISAEWYDHGYVENHSCIKVDVNVPYHFGFWASLGMSMYSSAGGGGCAYWYVYVNGELFREWADSGVPSWFDFYWNASSGGLYYFRIVYTGSDSQTSGADFGPSEFCFVANATVRPVRVYFSASKSKLVPGEQVRLDAVAVWAGSNETIRERLSFQFWQDDTSPIGNVVNTTSGSASVLWTYPFSGAHTVTVRVWSAGSLVCMVEPVTLEVCRETVLRFWVERGDSSMHQFCGKLVTSQGVPISGQTVKVYMNDSGSDVLYDTYTTYSDGTFYFNANFDPEETRIAYTIKAIYEGTEGQTATLNGISLDGTPYTVCSTTFCQFKPSANMTMLVVEPQATQETVPAKTPEQIQQEAASNDWFKVESEFSWWFPWFRLHFKMNPVLPQGNPSIDHGWSALPFGSSFTANNEVLGNILKTVSDFDAFIAFGLTFVAQYMALRAMGRTGMAVWIAIGLYVIFAIATTALWFSLKGNDPNFWLNAFLVTLFCATGGLALTGLISSVGSFLTSLARLALGKIDHIMNSLWGSGLDFLDITAVAFLFIDCGFMAMYLGLYLASLS